MLQLPKEIKTQSLTVHLKLEVRSYFSKRVINKLGCNEANPAPVEFKIKKFQNSTVEKLNRITLEI